MNISSLSFTFSRFYYLFDVFHRNQFAAAMLLHSFEHRKELYLKHSAFGGSDYRLNLFPIDGKKLGKQQQISLTLEIFMCDSE